MTIQSSQPPWNREEIIRSFGDLSKYRNRAKPEPLQLVRYLKKLIVWLTETYENIANAINENSKHYISEKIPDVSTGQSVWSVVQADGYISKVSCVLGGTISTADATITIKAGGITITTLTIPYSGAAAGDVITGAPSDDIPISEGDAIEIVTDGGSSGAQPVYVIIEMTRI